MGLLKSFFKYLETPKPKPKPKKKKTKNTNTENKTVTFGEDKIPQSSSQKKLRSIVNKAKKKDKERAELKKKKKDKKERTEKIKKTAKTLGVGTVIGGTIYGLSENKKKKAVDQEGGVGQGLPLKAKKTQGRSLGTDGKDVSKKKKVQTKPPVKKSYAIKSGDTLSQIARRRGTTLKALLAANPQIKNPNRIRVGQKINMSSPVKNRKSVYQGLSKSQMEKMSVKKKKAGGIVKKGMGKQILKGMKKFDPAMRVHKDAYIIGGIGTVGIGGGAALGHKDAVKKSKQKKEGRSRGIGGKDVSRKKKMSVKKKHGGRITYRMTGGQVVDAGYD